MSVTTPTFYWDFRQTVSAGGTVTDSISGNVATLTSSNASCSVSDGLTVVSDNSTAAGWADFQPFTAVVTGYTLEIYFMVGSIAWWPVIFAITDGTSSTDALVYAVFDEEGNDTFAHRHGMASATMNKTGSMNENQIYHLVITFDAASSTFTVYQDGSQVFQDTDSSNFTIGSGSTYPDISNKNKTFTYNRIGARGDGLRGINGNVYYARYWNGTAITSSEVSTLYANRSVINSFSTSYESGLVPSFDYDFRISNKDLINGTAEAKYYQYSSGTSSEITKTHTSNGVSIVGDTPTAAVSGSSSGRDNAGGQYIDLTGDLDTSYDQITIEVYVNIDSTTEKQVDNAGIFHFGRGDRDEMFKLYTNYGTKDYINMIAQYNDTTTNSITTFTGSSLFQNLCDGNTYMHLVYTCNGPTVTVYLNGASFLTETNSSFSFTSTTRSLCELGRSSMYSTVGGFLFATYKYCRIYNTALSSTQAATLYNNRDSLNHLSFALLRSSFGDVYLGQNLIKTLADYRTENIPLNDVSFAAFPINKFKETYILGDVDISGDTILRSNNTYFTDISADTFDVSGNLLMSDLSANSRLFVGDDVSFNSNVTIQGDLSFGGDISFNGTFTRALAGIGTGSGLIMNTDFSMNANLEVNGATTIKNDLHFNTYSDVSANPVLTDGTLLHNQKMEKLNHRYLLDISRSSPFSTLNYNTLPSNIYDNSTNSGICISGDGKYIRTVNSSDVSANALSYYSEDYGSSFQEDKDLSTKLSQFDVSINSLNDYNDYHNFIPTFGSDKVFMSYNGQHQLVPKGVSNKLTYDDFLYVSNNFGKNWNLRKNNTISTTTYAYTVTANGSSNYILNGGGFSSTAQPAVYIYLNESTEFTIDSTTNGNHPFKIGTSENGDEITDSRITSVTSGSNQVITFKPTNSGTFYYYCSLHSGMGSSINVIEPAGRFSLDASGSSWFWNTGAVSADGKHMYVSGKTGLWKSQDFGNSWYQASADSSFNYMSISADGKQVYGVNETKVYGSSDYGNTFSTLYSDSSTTDLNYAGISTSGNGKYLTIADVSGYNIYMSSNYGNSFDLKPLEPVYVEDSGSGIPTATYDWDFRVATPSDNIVKDSIAGLNATYVSGVTSTVSAGAYFSGATRSDDNSPHINLDAFPVGGGYSFEVYVKFDSVASYSRIFDFGNASGSGSENLLLARLGTSTEFYWGINSGTPFSNGTIVNGVFTHIVAILTTSGAEKVYQDGVLVNETGSTTKTSVSSRSNNYLGRSNWYNDAALEGNIQFFRVYNSELSSSDVTKLYENIAPTAFVNNNINCGMSHSGKIVLNSNYISYDYGNNFHFIPHLISNQLTNNDTFYSKANMEYLLDASNNLMLSIPYKSAQFQDIYSVGSIKVGTTTYSSDYRIKENVEELGEEDTVNEIRPVKYYNTNLKRDDYGLIAHELQEKYPFLVSGEKDGPEPQSINYNGLISLLVHEIKNLKKEYLELQEMKK